MRAPYCDPPAARCGDDQPVGTTLTTRRPLEGNNGNAGLPGLAGSNGTTYGALPITELPTNSSESPFIQFSAGLPATGADTRVPTLLGIGLVGGGFVLLATRRRLRSVR